MFELRGKYGEAKVFTDIVDESAIAQVINLLNQPYIEGSKIRMMPDIHAGAGCTIGTTMTIQDKICPNLVGVDIGCGMETTRIKERHIELQKLDKVIREKIPAGFEIRNQEHRFVSQIDLTKLECIKFIDSSRALKSIGTLGGGNHFIEVDRDENDNLYVVIHSGSRYLGLQIAKYYQETAYKSLTSQRKENLIAEMKAAGKEQEIQKALKNIKISIPKVLAYAEGYLMDAYLHDMKIAQSYANLNRKAMMDVIVKGMGFHVIEQFTTIHNYIDIENKILRKGAVSAQAGEKLLIPINMRDGSLICTGKGNEDWNFSAPHGAGRLMSRGEAKETFTVSEYKKQMSGIYTTSVGSGTLDECPMAYKPMDDIIKYIDPTVTIDAIIHPIYNFKAGGDG